MRTAMIDLCPVFNTNRMVQEYVVNGYAVADERRTLLEEDGFRRACELAIWKDKIRKGWHGVEVARVEVSLPERTHVGEHLDVTAWIRPGGLALDDLAPQVFLGRLHEARDIVGPEITLMENRGLTDDELRALPCVDRLSGQRHSRVDRAHPAATSSSWPSPRNGPDRLGQVIG